MITLAEIAPQFLQQRQLLGCLYPFSDGTDAHRMGQVDDPIRRRSGTLQRRSKILNRIRSCIGSPRSIRALRLPYASSIVRTLTVPYCSCWYNVAKVS